VQPIGLTQPVAVHFGKGRSRIIDAIGKANLCCRALGYLGGEEGCIFRECLTRSLERDLDKHD
jgi:hypothetical protein